MEKNEFSITTPWFDHLFLLLPGLLASPTLNIFHSFGVHFLYECYQGLRLTP